MNKNKQTRAAELRKYGVSLGYFADLAKRSIGYVRLWSAGFEKSSYLDNVAAELIAKRQAEQQVTA